MSFEWQTEEDDQHGEIPLTPAPETAVSPRKFRWLLWGVLPGLVILAGWLVYRQANARTKTAVSQTKADVISSHQLVTQAASQQDHSLLVSLLSGRDDSWADAQTSLGEQGLLFDRPQFGLAWQPGTLIAPEEVQINLNPRFDAAEISFPVAYALPDGRTIALQQTAVYRRGDQRWLLSPPEADFWGEEQTTETANITLTYPERDAATAARLADSLQTALDKLCQLPDAGCPNDLQLTIQLSPHPDSLLQLTDDKTLLASGADLVLPAPALVGLPLDEAGYKALANGYATQMATAVLAALTEYECCRQELLFRALLDWQLAELGLKTRPLDEQAYQQLLASNLPPHQWRALWQPQSDPKYQQTAYALVEYLQTQLPDAASAAAMMRALSQNSAFLNWLGAASGLAALDVVTPGFGQTWNAFLLTRAAAESAGPPLPYPPQPVQIACYTRIDSNRLAILNYDPAGSQWTETYSYTVKAGSPGYIVPVNAADNLYLAATLSTSTQSSRFALAQNGQTAAEFTVSRELPDQPGGITSPANFNVYAPSPDGRYILFSAGQGDPPKFAYRLLDVTACLGGNCQMEPISGPLHWSSDSQYAILEDGSDTLPSYFTALRPSPLYLTDARGENRREIGRGAAPFWLDAQTYGYVRYGDDGEISLVTAVTANNQPRLLTTMAELRQLIPADQQPDGLRPAFVYPAEHNPRFLVARAAPAAQNEETSYYFVLELNEDFTAVTAAEMAFLSVNPDPGSNTPAFLALDWSPDGRWRALYESDGRRQTTVTLTPRGHTGSLENQFAFPAERALWNGAWLAAVGDNYLLLTAPDYDYREIIPYDLAGCRVVYWGD